MSKFRASAVSAPEPSVVKLLAERGTFCKSAWTESARLWARKRRVGLSGASIPRPKDKRSPPARYTTRAGSRTSPSNLDRRDVGGSDSWHVRDLRRRHPLALSIGDRHDAGHGRVVPAATRAGGGVQPDGARRVRGVLGHPPHTDGPRVAPAGTTSRTRSRRAFAAARVGCGSGRGVVPDRAARVALFLLLLVFRRRQDGAGPRLLRPGIVRARRARVRDRVAGGRGAAGGKMTGSDLFRGDACVGERAGIMRRLSWRPVWPPKGLHRPPIDVSAAWSVFQVVLLCNGARWQGWRFDQRDQG